MHTDYLIIGQGIAGTLLSYELMRVGKSVLLIDQATQHKASLVASAVINPLIGKNWTVAKDSGNQIPIAIDTYNALEQLLRIKILHKKSLLIFHKEVTATTNFAQQKATGNPNLLAVATSALAQLHTDFYFENGVGKVAPIYTVDAHLLLQQWKEYLQEKLTFCEEIFSFKELKLQDEKIKYKDFSADKIVFCEGAIGRENPLFPHRNFTTNRGDVLLISIPQLSDEHLFQNKIRLVPRSDGLFWCGSNYTWNYKSLLPDEDWRMQTENTLKSWLKIPFQITDHLVAERPTTAGQMPILAQHALHQNIYFFNGLGTRGFSAGPAMAQHMVALLQQ